MSILKVTVFAALLLLCGVTAASAQVAQGAAIYVNVPNPFIVNGKTLSPGIYSIARTASIAGSPNLLIMTDGKSDSVLFNTLYERTAPAVDTEVEFQDVGGTYYLTGFRIKGSGTFNELRLSKSTRELMARNITKVVVMTASQSGF